MYVELNVGNETYKLRLNTRSSVSLEKALGYNPIGMLLAIDAGEMPKLSDMLIVLQAMLQPYHHGMSMEKVYDLYDRYVDDGHSMFDLIPVFMDVFQDSGYITKGNDADATEEDSKN